MLILWLKAFNVEVLEERWKNSTIKKACQEPKHYLRATLLKAQSVENGYMKLQG